MLVSNSFKICEFFIILIMNAEKIERFKGGKKTKRDRWYGVEKEPDFNHFRDWYHRVRKPENRYEDLNSASEVKEEYDLWVSLNRPKGK